MEATSKKIEQTPGKEQILITKGMPFSKIKKADDAGKFLVFDILDFPEISAVNLGKLSNSARMAYQMDLRNAKTVTNRVNNGQNPFEDRIKVIGSRDPLSRGHESMRKGQAKKLPEGMMHLNVDPVDVAELEDVGYRKAKPEEVEIVGSKVKAGAVVLTDRKGNVDNVTMLVEKDKYEKHRESDRAKTQARLDANIEATKENMKQYAPRVTLYDKSDLVRKP